MALVCFSHKKIKSHYSIPGFRNNFEIIHESKNRKIVIVSAATSKSAGQSPTTGASSKKERVAKPGVMPTGLTQEQEIVWNALNKEITNQNLTESEKETLNKMPSKERFDFLMRFPDSFGQPSEAFLAEHDIFHITLILKNKNLRRQAKFTFVTLDVFDPLTPELVCDNFYQLLWCKHLANIYTKETILRGIQVRRIHPQTRITSVYTKSYVVSGKQNESESPSSQDFYGIKMGSVYLKGGFDDHVLILGFIPETLKSLSSSSDSSLPLLMENFAKELVEPLVLTDIPTTPDKPKTTVRLCFQSFHKKTPLQFLPVTNTAILGFVRKAKPEFIENGLGQKNGNFNNTPSYP